MMWSYSSGLNIDCFFIGLFGGPLHMCIVMADIYYTRTNQHFISGDET